jgi:hypothetical protein
MYEERERRFGYLVCICSIAIVFSGVVLAVVALERIEYTFDLYFSVQSAGPDTMPHPLRDMFLPSAEESRALFTVYKLI